MSALTAWRSMALLRPVAPGRVVAMSSPRWVRYKSYSGFALGGTIPFERPVNAALHVDRAVWLAGQLEAPRWGSVQGWDGCGISGGILHNIAVSPKTKEQGSFWALLRAVMESAVAGGSDRARELVDQIVWKLDETQMELARDGIVRFDASGGRVPGETLRQVLGSADGKVPRTGPPAERAKWWVSTCAGLLGDHSTFAAQSDYAARWLSGGNRWAELEFYRRFGRDVDSIIGLPSASLPPAIELAMCVYHAFSVNAPAPAAECLAKIGDWENDPVKAAKHLIRLLGKKKYGRWQDEPGEGRNRYDRTRRAVWSKPDIWDRALARELMPMDL